MHQINYQEATTNDKNNYLLYFETELHEVEADNINEDNLAILELNKKEKIVTLFFHPEITTIDRLTALRLANSIIKTGFLFSNNERVGTGFTIKVAKEFTEFLNKLRLKPSSLDKNVDKIDHNAIFESITDYFWVELFGKVLKSWDELSDIAKNDLFSVINVKYLSDTQMHELFLLRHQNNKTEFMNKLAEYR